MSNGVQGIHHVTAISGDSQRNVDFYIGVLGLRLVKRTVNFDDPSMYHLYFGDESGSPGTILTFFALPGGARRGQSGNGQSTAISFSVSDKSLDFWIKRFKKLKVEFNGPFDRFDEEVICIRDSDGIELELVGVPEESRIGRDNGIIPQEHSIRGIHSVALSEEGYERTANFMTDILDFHRSREHGNRFRYVSDDGGPGTIVDILCRPFRFEGNGGAGTIHHIALRTPDDERQQDLHHRLVEEGFNVSPILDRKYFHSIYFREPGNILFEIATDPPGFTVDESMSRLGSGLQLPSDLEEERCAIEKNLPHIIVPSEIPPEAVI